MLVACGDCGVSGDGKPGWLEDHQEVCAEREVTCPCNIYGCEERMPRRRVGAHLSECPACGVVCCFSKNDEQTLQCVAPISWQSQLFTERPHVRVDWENKGSGIVGDEHSCRGIIRRTDLEAHHRFAHAEINAIFQKCPYCHPTDSQESKTDTYVEAPPASPLHPPPGTRYTVPHQTGENSWRPWIPNGVQFYPGGQLGEISRKKGWRDERAENKEGNNPSAGCSYQRQILAPIFNTTPPPAPTRGPRAGPSARSRRRRTCCCRCC